MSIARQFGFVDSSRDPKLKVPEIPQKPAAQNDSALVARVAKLEGELKAALSRISELERNAVTRNAVTVGAVTHNAPVTRNANAERQRAYRARKRAEKQSQE